MRSINADILLRNRSVYIHARTKAFEQAARLVDDILDLFQLDGEAPKDATPLQGLLAAVVDRMFHARFYARMSVGGNNVTTPAGISDHERAFIDHVETMYSYSRSISRFLRHETLIDSFVRDRTRVTGPLKTYLAEIRSSDFNLIYVNMVSMKNRLSVYSRYMRDVGAEV